MGTRVIDTLQPALAVAQNNRAWKCVSLPSASLQRAQVDVTDTWFLWPVSSRTAVVVRADAESRRAVSYPAPWTCLLYGRWATDGATAFSELLRLERLFRGNRFTTTYVRTLELLRSASRRSGRTMVLASMPGVQVLGLLAAAGLVAARPAGAIDLFDDRKVRDNGYDLIYEARDLDLPQATRDGFTQVRITSRNCLPASASCSGSIRAPFGAWQIIACLLDSRANSPRF